MLIHDTCVHVNWADDIALRICVYGHALYLHDSQIVWSRPTSSENSVASFVVIFDQVVIDVLIVLRDLFVESLDDASNPMWSSQAIRPFKSDQNDVMVCITAPPILLLRPTQFEDRWSSWWLRWWSLTSHRSHDLRWGCPLGFLTAWGFLILAWCPSLDYLEDVPPDDLSIGIVRQIASIISRFFWPFIYKGLRG